MASVDKGSSVKLINLLREEVVQLRAFVGILKEEQQVLVKGDLDRLMPLATEKSTISQRLGNLTEQRNRILTSVSLPPDRTGMETWLNQPDPDMKPVRQEWMDFLSLAVEARALNQANGVVIATRLQHNQQALSVLLSACNQAALYGPDGQTKANGGGRFFGAA